MFWCSTAFKHFVDFLHKIKYLQTIFYIQLNEDGQNDVEPVGKDVLIKNLRGLQQIYDLQDENHLEFSNEKMADVRFCLIYRNTI